MEKNFGFIFDFLNAATIWVANFLTSGGYKDEKDYEKNRPYRHRSYPGVFYASQKNGKWGVTINTNNTHTAIELPEKLSSFTYAVAFAMAIEDYREKNILDVFLTAHGWCQGKNAHWNTGALYVRTMNDKFYVYRPILGKGYDLIPNPNNKDDGGYELFTDAVLARNRQLFNLIAINKDPRVLVWRTELAVGYFKAIGVGLNDQTFKKYLISAINNCLRFTTDSEMMATLDACQKTLKLGTPYKGRYWINAHIERFKDYLNAAEVDPRLIKRICQALNKTIKAKPVEKALTPEELAKACEALNRKWGNRH